MGLVKIKAPWWALFSFFIGVSSPLASPQGGDHPVFVDEQVDLGYQEESVELAVEQARFHDEDFVVRTKRGTAFYFEMIPRQIPGAPDKYQRLSEREQILFQENRVFFLSLAANVLDRSIPSLSLGFGSWSKDRLVSFRKKGDSEFLQTIAKKGGFRNRGTELTRMILQAFDRALWDRPRIVAEQNEFAVSLSLGLVVQGGWGSKTLGGIVGLGIDLGYNRDKNIAVFEISARPESIQKAHTPTALFGIMPKAGFTIRKVDLDGEDPTKMRSGHSVYTPLAPFYAFRSDRNLEMGMNNLFFTLPPGINATFSYSTSSHNKPLLRITTSHFKPEFYRLYLGFPQRIKQICGRLFSRQETTN